MSWVRDRHMTKWSQMAMTRFAHCRNVTVYKVNLKSMVTPRLVISLEMWMSMSAILTAGMAGKVRRRWWVPRMIESDLSRRGVTSVSNLPLWGKIFISDKRMQPISVFPYFRVRLRLFRICLFPIRLFCVGLFCIRLFRVCLFRIRLPRVGLFRFAYSLTFPCSPIPCLPIPCSPNPCSPIPCSPIPCSPIPCSPIPCSPISSLLISYLPIAYIKIFRLQTSLASFKQALTAWHSDIRRGRPLTAKDSK